MKKVKHAKFRNFAIRIGTENVQFDASGVAEISDDLFKEYENTGLFFEVGKEPKQKAFALPSEGYTEKEVSLMNEIERLKVIQNDKNAKIAQLTQNEAVWRKAVQDLMDNKLELMPEIQAKLQAAENTESTADQLRATLAEMHPKSIQKYLREDLNLPENEVNALSTREDLINYAIIKLTK